MAQFFMDELRITSDHLVHGGLTWSGAASRKIIRFAILPRTFLKANGTTICTNSWPPERRRFDGRLLIMNDTTRMLAISEIWNLLLTPYSNRTTRFRAVHATS